MSAGRRSSKREELQTWISWFTIICVLASSLVLGANRPAAWSLLSFLMIVAFALQMLVGYRDRDLKNVKELWFATALLIAVVIWVLIQITPGLPAELHHPLWALVNSPKATISADPTGAGMLIIRLFCYIMIFWIAVRTCAQRGAVVGILRTIGIFSTALAVFGIFAYVRDFNPILGAEALNDAVKASFVNRNSYATFATFGVLANMSAFQLTSQSVADSTSSRVRNFLERFFEGAWVHALGTLLCLVAVALTQSRAGGIAAVLGIFVFLLASRNKGQKSSLVMPLAMLAIGVFVAFTSTSDLVDRLLMTTEEEVRFQVYPLVVEAIQSRPLLGHGWGSFHEAFRPLVPLNGALAEWDLAHNSYLENVFELGIPAACAFYFALSLIVWRIWRGTLVRRRDREFSVFALSCVAAAGFHSIFDFSLQMPAVAALFAFILGIGWGHSFPSQIKSNHAQIR